MFEAIKKFSIPALRTRWHAARFHKARLKLLEARLHGELHPDRHVEMPLSQMRPGEQGHVLSLCSQCDSRQHLLELGFTTGTIVEVIRVAPLGDPMTVRIRGYQLSLRRSEAEAMTMRRCPPESD